jgi:hypothetical protein
MTDNSNVERSEAGDRKFEFAQGDAKGIELIDNHITRYIGEPAGVFHEIISDLVHVDIHIVKPTPKRNYYTLVTSGMSDRPMTNMPKKAEHLKYAELVLCLPPSWPLPPLDFKRKNGIWPLQKLELLVQRVTKPDYRDERNYWPLRWLKILARFPHEYNTWLWATHTIPNDDPPKPFAANTKFCCMLLTTPTLMFADGFLKLKVDDDKTIHFLSVIPLYREEMDFKLKYGFDKLIDRLNEHHGNEVIDANRKNVCI